MARVMLIDDEQSVLDMVKAVLESAGHTVAAYTESPQALADLFGSAGELPRLLVIDVMMPGLDGIEFARKLRENPRTAALPILVISAHEKFRGRVSSMPGVVGFVQKPFTLPALRATFKGLLTP